MATMNVSLPDALKEFVDEKVAAASYGTASEYIRELIRRDQDRSRLREQLLQGAQAPAVGTLGANYFDGLRSGIRKHARAAA
jgi:antitoxin ParD1/3/4